MTVGRRKGSRREALVFPMMIIVASLASHSALAAKYRLRGNSEFDGAALRFFNKESRKIMGGVDAARGMFPWQVSLQNGDVGDRVSAHYCGGSIYKKNWIVTAAHCLTMLEAADIKVVVGASRLNTNSTRRNIESIFLHPNYDDDSRVNDVGLILLGAPVKFDLDTQPIELLDSDMEPLLLKAGAELVVTGWGLKDFSGGKVAPLQWASVPYVDRTECSRPLSWGSRIKESMLCAGGNQNDACTYDSGGPLVVSDTSNKKRLAGIVSWGGGCSDVLQYGVYARVATAVGWINECIAAAKKCNKTPH
jgi:trypsin